MLCSECEDTVSAEIGDNTCFTCGAMYEVGHDGKGNYTTVSRISQAEKVART